MAEFKIGRLRYTWRGVWTATTFYNRDAVVQHQGKTYVCLEAHTSSTNFDAELNYVTPSGASEPRWSLMIEGKTWKGVYTPGTYYSLGNIVNYGGTVYQCTVPHTAGATITLANWTVGISSANFRSDWTSNTAYGVGDQVKYGGVVYNCTTAHVSAATTSLGLELNLGNWAVAFNGVEYKGDWSPVVRYKLNDVVRQSGSLWIAVTGHLSGAAFDDADWALWLPGENYKEFWNALVTYDLGDVVKYGGYSYISNISENLGIPPSTNSVEWSLVTIGYNLRGDWLSSAQYRVGDVVRRGGRVFTAITDNSGTDPSGAVVSTNYVATGSSGTTLKVTSTTGIQKGMSVVGNGFSQRQTVVAVVSSDTLTVSEGPNETPIDGTTIRFTGINATNWKFVTTGVSWTNRWEESVDYGIGDLAVWQNATYICVANHTSSTLINPLNDTNREYWQVYLYHARKNAMNTDGDLVSYNNGAGEAVHIGEESQVLKIETMSPNWKTINVIPKVFYVTPNGVDAALAQGETVAPGATWDKPWGSIKYACDTIRLGFYYQNASELILQNRAFLQAEIWNWMEYQFDLGTLPPFDTPATLDEAKTKRDVGYIIDAIAYDMKRGGNSQSVAATLAYFSIEPGEKFITAQVEAQMPYFVAALEQLRVELGYVLNNSPAPFSYQTLNGLSLALQVGQVVDTLANPEANSAIESQSLIDLVINSLSVQDKDLLPPPNNGITATVMVKTGTYYESLPIIVPANTAIVGDELRGATVTPKNVINTVAIATDSATDRVQLISYNNVLVGEPIQFVGNNLEMFGGLESGTTYYVADVDTSLGIILSNTLGGTARPLTDGVGQMTVYGGDALRNMFLLRDATGLRNMTLSGMLGTLGPINQYETRRPTGGTYVAFDPGMGPDDSSAWIIRRSPYIQNVTTFGKGAVGCKIDGTLHNGGLHSMVSNDFTQVIGDGIGVWCTGPNSLTELVSVFAYYGYAGYLAEDGGRIRATNGNTSYGTYGVIAEGYDITEVPVTGNVYNRSTQVQASVQSSFGQNAQLVALNYSNSGSAYNTTTTNLIKHSNHFDETSVWTDDNNVSIQQNVLAPNGYAEGWTLTGNTSVVGSDYIEQDIAIQPAGAAYTNILATNITGSGVNASFNVTVTSTGYTVVVNSGGSGYVAGNTMFISGSTLGGVDGNNDCVITVATLSGSAILTVTNTGTPPIGSNLSYTISIYAKKGTATLFDLQGIFNGTSDRTSGITYNFNTDTITPYNVTAGFVPTQYGRTPLEDGWYRIWFALNDLTAQNDTLTLRLFPRGSAGVAGYNYFYGSQIELSDADYTPSFYLETTTRLETAYANFKVVGAGTGADLVGNEIRSGAVFETRVTDPGSGAGGSGYLTASNASQLGDETYIQIAGSDTRTASEYIGMRVFINSGTGAGQYGFISAFDEVNKVAQVLKESFDPLSISASETTGDTFTINNGGDTSNLYVNQMVQFVPTAYTTSIASVGVDQIAVTGTLGGVINTMTVPSTKRLRRNMEVTFSGAVYGGVTTSFVYFITEILTDTTFQISTTFGGTTWQLLTGTPGPTPMYLNFPTNDSYINGSTTNMTATMPIQFTGTSVGGILVGTTYYVNDVIDSNTFSISSTVVSLTITDADTGGDVLTTSDDTASLTLFNPVVFSGDVFGGLVEDQRYYVSKIVNSTDFQIVSSLTQTVARATAAGSNLITVDSTTGFIVNNPIVFIGTPFGDIINEKVYYILAINDSTSFTISLTPGGAALNITTATGESVVRTTPAATNLASGAGTMTATTTGTKKSLTNGYGSMIGTYKTKLFGGVSQGTTYYIKTINSAANKFTVSESLGGPTFNLETKTGSMKLGEVGWDHINPGTPIEPVLDSSSVYFIEPRTTYTDPSFAQVTGSAVTLSPGTNWTAIGYGKNAWLALPSSGTIGAYSTNGTSWSAITLPGNRSWSAITYGNSYWVAVSSGGTGNSVAAYSKSNGLGWRTANLPTVATYGAVAYGNGVFVTVASNSSNCAYSTDFGATWSAGSGLPNDNWKSVAYGNGVFVAIASTSNVGAYSTDGITWTSTTMPTISAWSSITYGKGRFVAVASTSAYPAYSFDGSTWYESKIPLAASSIDYGQGVFVAVQSGNSTAYTTEDGLHWKTRTVTSSTYGAVKFGYASITFAGKFVTLAGSNVASAISAGCRAKGRPVITSGIITSVSMFEPGSNYSTEPTVTFTDPNVTTLAVVTPRLSNGSLGIPTFINRGTGYSTTSTEVSITGSGYADAYQTGLTIILNNLTKLPQPGDNLVISGVSQIYKVTSAVAKFGTTVPSIEANVQVAPDIKIADSADEGTTVTIRQKYSQCRLTGHDFLNVGFGNVDQANYPGLPSDTVLAPQDQAVEVNFGRVFYTSTDQDGNFKVGSLFAVEQATGIITLSASQFGLSGLETLSLGGIAVGGQSVVIRQFSTDPTFVANSNEIIPTQKAIKSYLTGRLSQGGSNTFTGQLTAGTVVIGGADRIYSTIPEGTLGSNVRMVNKVLVDGPQGAWGGDGAAMAFFMKTWHRR